MVRAVKKPKRKKARKKTTRNKRARESDLALVAAVAGDGED